MSLERYVILRVPQELPAGLESAYPSPREDPQRSDEAVLSAARGDLRPEISVAELDRREVADLSRDPEIAAAAPEIPTQLIEPQLAAQASPVPGETESWGVRAVGAFGTHFDGAGVKVAVLDTGIDAGHEAFRGMTFTRENFTKDGAADVNGHGTHCAGTLFGRDVAGVRIGVAPGITEAFIGKVLDDQGRGDTASLAQAIVMAADAGCQVISMSLSFDWPELVRRKVELEGYPAKLAAAIGLHRYRANIRLFDSLGTYIAARARQGGEHLLVAASGNDSERTGNLKYEMPAAAPSEAEGFISVGAVGLGDGPDPKLVVANFSNTACDLCAPGVDILSAKANTPHDLDRLSGTSMATPHVAGVAALWLQSLSTSAPVSSFYSGPPVLRRRLEGATRNDRLLPGFDSLDVGLGVVHGPE